MFNPTSDVSVVVGFQALTAGMNQSMLDWHSCWHEYKLECDVSTVFGRFGFLLLSYSSTTAQVAHVRESLKERFKLRW